MNWASANGPNGDRAASWLAAGWNVGILYWKQFADEGEVTDAEAKIWATSFSRSGTAINMRWRNVNGSSSQTLPSSISGKNIADIFFDVYRTQLYGYTASNIRLAGHSLGHQWAIAVTKNQ